ncbi:hypothetical protein BpHYR1_042129 [Brachionus plicatilis]|uniref:Uncharacterized protein n=1 Tax=Brachionus plicatilis TaxID=10195 RepID=A0A3M7R2P4_BRAPC|nr:hypothetical protein BpHYR1_042129 [Brachionus plicatilis]
MTLNEIISMTWSQHGHYFECKRPVYNISLQLIILIELLFEKALSPYIFEMRSLKILSTIEPLPQNLQDNLLDHLI